MTFNVSLKQFKDEVINYVLFAIIRLHYMDIGRTWYMAVRYLWDSGSDKVFKSHPQDQEHT
ncbi:MAG: hypothetical protein IPO16_09890 [Saprospiraceae bacterium]|nr:hypothetical protein [Saprospiraceae bacterium]